jgi:hypothetical protein
MALRNQGLKKNSGLFLFIGSGRPPYPSAAISQNQHEPELYKTERSFGQHLSFRSSVCAPRVPVSTCPVLPNRVGTQVTCRESERGPYSSHLPQNLGDGVGNGNEGRRIQPFIIFPTNFPHQFEFSASNLDLRQFQSWCIPIREKCAGPRPIFLHFFGTSKLFLRLASSPLGQAFRRTGSPLGLAMP